MGVTNRHVLTFLLTCAAVLVPVQVTRAGDWKWLSEFTPESSPELIRLHEEILAAAPTLTGIPVENTDWSENGFKLHIVKGVLYPEPPVRGYPAGAYFEGQATFNYEPATRKGRDDLKDFLSLERFQDEPVSTAYLWTLRDIPVSKQMGIAAEATVPLPATESYAHAKRAVRQLGMSPLFWFVNREQRSRGTALVLMAVDRLRKAGYPDSYLMYRFDPTLVNESRLFVFGHEFRSGGLKPEWYYFRQLVEEDRGEFAPLQGTPELYKMRVSFAPGREDTTEDTEVHFKPGKGLHAAKLVYIPWMKVRSVTGCDGKQIPFTQWAWLPNDPNYDTNLVVMFPEALPTDSSCTLTVSARGFIGAEEDDWFPHFFDANQLSLHELEADIKKSEVVVAPGHLLRDEVVEGRRYFHYKTTHPQDSFTVYDGEYTLETTDAEGIKVEVYAHKRDIHELQNEKFVATEIGNMLKVYKRRLGPLDIDTLRVVSTNQTDGRGFEGMILLGRGGFSSDTSNADTFRAHEVAHQWWGNMVRPYNWARDRWLSEAVAEYMAMDYYSIRYDNPAKTREHINRSWIFKELFTSDYSVRDLLDKKIKKDSREHYPLVDGLDNVYTMGPAVIQMLRYLTQVQKGGDEPFWETMRGILQKHKDLTLTTEQFFSAFEESLGMKLDWFEDQWYSGRRIPEVSWKSAVEQSDKGWLVSVDAEQTESYKLLIPIYLHFKGGNVISRPLVLDGATGRRRLVVPEKPVSVTLNDFYEALIVTKP